MSIDSEVNLNKDHSKCVFCRIVSKEIPSGEIARTENLIVITALDGGYPLVATVRHIDNMLDPEYTDDLAAEFGVMTRRLARVVVEADDVKGVTVLVNNGRNSGQEINHLHGHIIPRGERDGLIVAKRGLRMTLKRRIERAQRYEMILNQ